MTKTFHSDPNIIQLVTQMRTLQKEYFRARSQDVLDQCKIYENLVDKALENLLDNQMRLFNEQD